MKKLLKASVGERVLVRRLDGDSNLGAIIIPETCIEKPLKGLVVAISNEETNKYIKVGDTVLYEKYAGADITVDGEDLVVMLDTNIIAVL